METKRVTSIRLPSDLRRWLTNMARELSMTRSALILKILRDWRDNRKEKK